MKVLVEAFNQKEALVGAFSMTDGSFVALDTTLYTAAGDRHSRDEMVLRYGGCTVCRLSAAHLIVAALLVNNFTSPVTTVTIALLHGGWSTGCKLDLTYTGVAHCTVKQSLSSFPRGHEGSLDI